MNSTHPLFKYYCLEDEFTIVDNIIIITMNNIIVLFIIYICMYVCMYNM